MVSALCLLEVAAPIGSNLSPRNALLLLGATINAIAEMDTLHIADGPVPWRILNYFSTVSANPGSKVDASHRDQHRRGFRGEPVQPRRWTWNTFLVQTFGQGGMRTEAGPKTQHKQGVQRRAKGGSQCLRR
jgi:hypothetical protein